MNRLVALLLGPALVAGLVLPVAAAKPARAGNDAFAWVLQTLDVGGLVEQQSDTYTFDCLEFGQAGCVWNPTAYGPTQYGEACPWDIDDNFTVWATPGTLATGTTSFAQCRIADGGYKLTAIRLTAKSPDLVVTIGFAAEGVTFTLVPDLVDREYVYTGCVQGPIYAGSTVPRAQTIEGSYGGWGVPTTVTVSVTNNTGRAIRGVYAQAISGIATPGRLAYCRSTFTDFFSLSGAVWRTGL